MVSKEIEEKILNRANACKLVYSKRGYFTVGDVACFDFKLKEVMEVARKYKWRELRVMCPHCGIEEGYYYINDNWKNDLFLRSFQHPEKSDMQKSITEFLK
nr:MAG: hypothetical protein [Lokiarchaeota virus Ratatoskr Meg22_1012]